MTILSKILHIKLIIEYGARILWILIAILISKKIISITIIIIQRRLSFCD
jgi:hypothetical protein